jgi:hypothetical protein
VLGVGAARALLGVSWLTILECWRGKSIMVTQSCGLVLWQLYGPIDETPLDWCRGNSMGYFEADFFVQSNQYSLLFASSLFASSYHLATIATMNNPTLQAKIDSAVTILKTIEDAIEEANLEPHESITIDVSGTPNPEPPLTMPVSEWIHIIQAMRVTIVQLGMQIHNRN